MKQTKLGTASPFNLKTESFLYPAQFEVNLFAEDNFSVKQKYQFDSLRSIKIS